MPPSSRRISSTLCSLSVVGSRTEMKPSSAPSLRSGASARDGSASVSETRNGSVRSPIAARRTGAARAAAAAGPVVGVRLRADREAVAFVVQPEGAFLAAEDPRRRAHRLVADRVGRGRLRDGARELEQGLQVVGLAPLSLVQASVLERHRGMACEHLEQPHVVLVELIDPELRDRDHADHARPVAKRHGDLRLLDHVGAGDHHRVLALQRVADEQGLRGLRDVARDALADAGAREVDAFAATGEQLAAEGDRDDVVALDHRDAAVVVIDQQPQLVGDHLADLADVVQPVELAAQALEHLQVRDRADVSAAGGLAVGPLARGLLEQHDLVLAARLGRHHRGLRAGDELARVHRVLRALRDADGDRDLACRAELDLRERLRQPPCQRKRLVRAAARHDHPELLAAEPADDVRATQRRAQQLGEIGQHLVARAVAVDVVDALEVVDVEHQHRDAVAGAVGARQLGAQPLVEVAVVVEAGQRVGLRLVLEPRPDLGVVERQRGRVGEAGGELELLVAEGRVLAEAVHVQHALDQVACDQRNGDQRLRLVGRRARHGLRARVEMSLVRADGLAMEGGPAGDPLAEGRAAVHDLVGPLVAGEHRGQLGLRLVGLVDRKRVVRHELGERVRDSLEQVVEAVLGEDVVEDVRQLPVGLDERIRTRGFRDGWIRRPAHAQAQQPQGDAARP